MANSVPEVQLKTLEAYTRDVDRGICRIDYDVMDKIHVSTGDCIEIESNKKIVGKVLPLYPSDEGKGIIRLDGVTRKNLGIDVTTPIKVRKIITEHCKSFKVIPIESIPPIDDRYITDALEGQPLIVGMEFRIPYFGGRLKFKAVSVNPVGAVMITQKSICTILDKAENEEMIEFQQLIDSQKNTLKDQLKEALKNKNADQVEMILDKVRNLDIVKNEIKSVFQDEKLPQRPITRGTIKEALQEAIEEWIKKNQSDANDKSSTSNNEATE